MCPFIQWKNLIWIIETYFCEKRDNRIFIKIYYDFTSKIFDFMIYLDFFIYYTFSPLQIIANKVYNESINHDIS